MAVRKTVGSQKTRGSWYVVLRSQIREKKGCGHGLQQRRRGDQAWCYSRIGNRKGGGPSTNVIVTAICSVLVSVDQETRWGWKEVDKQGGRLVVFSISRLMSKCLPRKYSVYKYA